MLILLKLQTTRGCDERMLIYRLFSEHDSFHHNDNLRLEMAKLLLENEMLHHFNNAMAFAASGNVSERHVWKALAVALT